MGLSNDALGLPEYIELFKDDLGFNLGLRDAWGCLRMIYNRVG